MRVALYGPAKTGTTALFYKIAQAMPAHTIRHFEPRRGLLPQWRRQRLIERLGFGHHRPMLVKFLPFHAPSRGVHTQFGAFDRQVLIVRDPRDQVVSTILYKVYHAAWIGDPVAEAALLDLLEAKQRDPRSITLLTLAASILQTRQGWFEPAEWLAELADQFVAQPLCFDDQHPAMFRFQYEDMVRGNLAALSAYLDLPLARETEVDPQVSRVVRRRGMGDWQHWFTPEDVDLLQLILQPYLDRYYPQADWSLAEAPAIDPAHGAHYALRLIDERRAMMCLPARPAG